MIQSVFLGFPSSLRDRCRSSGHTLLLGGGFDHGDGSWVTVGILGYLLLFGAIPLLPRSKESMTGSRGDEVESVDVLPLGEELLLLRVGSEFHGWHPPLRGFGLDS